MGRAEGLLNRIDKLLNKSNVTDRVVYKRRITRTGGDPLTGRGFSSVTKTDTALNPVPAVVQASNFGTQVVNGVVVQPLTDYVVYVSPNALSKSEITDKDVCLVFKSGSAEEEFFIHSYDTSVIEGSRVLFTVLARSKSRS